MSHYLFLILSLASPALAADLTGEWEFDGDVNGNPVAMACAIKQEGGKLTGACKSSGRPAEWTINGDVQEQKVTFSYSVDYNGTSYTLQYVGKVDESGTGITGDIQVAGTAGTFSAKKT